jgi:hypothetical protein
LLASVFLIGTSLPLAGLLLGLDSAFVLAEKRRLADMPEIAPDRKALAEWPSKFETFFNDRFGFRKRLIHWLSAVKVWGLGVSSSPDVTLGRHGWLFLAGSSVDYYRAIRPFSPEQLGRWRDMLQSRHDWLASRGIRYLVVFGPNKDSIYPEFMSASLNRVSRETRLDQLQEYLRAHSTVDVLDLREPLRRAKSGPPLYYPTDTHWNLLGGFIAYREILRALSAWFPKLQPLPRDAFREIRTIMPHGDLADMLGLGDQWAACYYWLLPRSPRPIRRVNIDPKFSEGIPEAWWGRPFATECDAAEGPRALMFRDSFAEALIPFLSPHFRRIAFVIRYDSTSVFNFNKELIERERPKVVIQEMVERLLIVDLP